jgi:hypothetical protein
MEKNSLPSPSVSHLPIGSRSVPVGDHKNMARPDKVEKIPLA